jgi:prepilin-type N-terminal cleavage/methylation domain-containing protein
MTSRLIWKTKIWTPDGRAPGFTLVELMIAAVVAGVVILAAYTSYDVQQKSYSVQREAARMEANLRAAMFMIKNDLRNAGRSSEMNGKIGTNDIIAESRRWSDCPGLAVWSDTLDTLNGFQGLTLWTAQDLVNNNTHNPPPDGIADDTDPASYQRIVYRLWDPDNNGRRQLHRFVYNSAGALLNADTLVADGIDDIAFAFAYDNTNSGTLDRQASAAGASTIIWAIDDDATPGLDTNLDSNQSGTIDQNDAGGDNVIDFADGGLPASIKMQKIRAVRIWILARSGRTYTGYVNSGIFQVGRKVFKPHDVAVANGDNTDKYRYLVLSSSVHLRNREQLDVSQN